MITRGKQISIVWKVGKQHLMGKETEEQLNITLIDYPSMADGVNESTTDQKHVATESQTCTPAGARQLT